MKPRTTLVCGAVLVCSAVVGLVSLEPRAKGDPARGQDLVVAGSGSYSATILRILDPLFVGDHPTCSPATEPQAPNVPFNDGTGGGKGHVFYASRVSHVADNPYTQVVDPFNGSVQFRGFIDNSADVGSSPEVASRLFGRFIQNECTGPHPFRATLRRSITLHNVEVAGRTGSLVLESDDMSETLPGVGFVTRGHFTVDGIAGQLAGARGEGFWSFRATATDEAGHYRAEMRLPAGQ